MKIREYRLSDTQAIANLFYDTIHEINIADYTQEQVEAWAPKNMDYEVWHKRLQVKLPYIAEDNGEIVGFGELEADGHIDCFYCHSKHQRKGIGSKLLTHIENTAKSQGITRLYTEASITAKPFFENKGFIVVREQQVERRGVWFKNYVMEKYL
ncbi:MULTISPECIES: GNAT family N-acetyltransferase [Nostoc]|uniref:GNAT family N-acetyltransferase n=1 Tax=Nostoc paludosum FACHB-159 TaxID=2692908 RepID=A0ABR8K179_9NOSO|nr:MULTISPECIES: GNAT family N-acetyltransferase [Nostoc]MBD2676469.1 GNAT family N-acetyltransferase [Nostoc sp. FACHB-857]MBD2732398.1 GNAT family N-acetyltransferase [Nostoc paludosum FACHB-159]